MNSCLICNSEVDEFHSFGRMPIANGFLSTADFSTEYFFELKVGFCLSCSMVQLTQMVDREKMFHDQYAFFSSTSRKMEGHFKDFACDVMQNRMECSDPLVVELGSNDGIMLQNFAKKGIRHLGIEPSANVAQVAVQKGIQTWCRFFDEKVADEIIAEKGRADVILGANVMCHIPYMHSVLSGVRRLLKPQGFLIFEDPYLGDIVEKISYDQIYDEHAFYFSLRSVSRMIESHDLELVDASRQDVHGGSMRYFIARKGWCKKTERLLQLQAYEEKIKLGDFETYSQLSRKIESSRNELKRVLNELKDKRRSVVGYGATSKSTTVTNYCGVTPDLLEYISDTTPIKQGKFSPGVHIPIRSHESFKKSPPDVTLLFAWNHAEEIFAKEQEYRKKGGEWLVYVPKVQVIK